MTSPKFELTGNYLRIIAELERELILPDECGFLERRRKTGAIKTDIDKTLKSMVSPMMCLGNDDVEEELQFSHDLYSGDMGLPEHLISSLGATENTKPVIYVSPCIGDVVLPPVFTGNARCILTNKAGETGLDDSSIRISMDYCKKIRNSLLEYIRKGDVMTGVCFVLARYGVVPMVEYRPLPQDARI
jgi:hypothetical protein